MMAVFNRHREGPEITPKTIQGKSHMHMPPLGEGNSIAVKILH